MIHFLNDFIVDHINMLTINLDSTTLPTHNCQLTKANAGNKPAHNAFRRGWLRQHEAMGRGKISFFDVLQ